MSTSVFNKYPAGTDFGGKRVLNVGCGYAQYKFPNVVNVDAFDICKPDVVLDLNQTPYPFESESFDHVIANHIIEHLPNWWGAFNEFARVLKPNGVLEIWVPGGGSDAIRGFRDHVVEINGCSFYGIYGTYRAGGNAWADENALCHANRMKMTGLTTNMEKEWWIQKAPKSLKRWMWKHLRNVTIEDGYFFRKVTVAEHKAEMDRFNDRAKGYRAAAL